MQTKTFFTVTSIAILVTLTAAVLSVIGIIITGLYPGIIVLLILAMIPIGSRFYARKMSSNLMMPAKFFFTTLTIINLLSILAVLWMTFVILHDRVLHDCC